MHQPVKDFAALADFGAEARDLIFVLDVANEDLRVAEQLGDRFLSLGRAHDVDDVRAGFTQHLADMKGHALAVRHAEDQERFTGELEEVHRRCGDVLQIAGKFTTESRRRILGSIASTALLSSRCPPCLRGAPHSLSASVQANSNRTATLPAQETLALRKKASASRSTRSTSISIVSPGRTIRLKRTSFIRVAPA